MSEALYRKYRPQTFADVVGQDHIERTIRNAIEQDKVSHAYLFCGPRGTGKTTTARLLAKALLCEHGPTPDPDGTCRDCQEIAAGAHPDVYELDAASRTGVENVREEIIGRVQFAPTRGRKKVYIIDEVHMLSTAAFNALLKTLEEPPDHVVFILCTTDPQKVPETIHSRCQRFDFRRIGSESIVSRLGAICVSEGVEFEGEALELIAHRAEGGMRNALTALEQVIAFGEGKVTLRATEDMLGSLDVDDMAEIVNAIGVRDVAACFTWTARYIETGADLAQFARDLAAHFRNMYVLSLAGADVALDVSEAERRELAEELKNYGPDRLARLLAVLGDALAELRTSTNPRLSFEIALTRMVRPDSDLTLASLAERVEALEAGRSAVAYGSVGATAAGIPAAGAPAPSATPAEGAVAMGAPTPSAPQPPQPQAPAKPTAPAKVTAPAAPDIPAAGSPVSVPASPAGAMAPSSAPAAPIAAPSSSATARVAPAPAAHHASPAAAAPAFAERPGAPAASAPASAPSSTAPTATPFERPAAPAAVEKVAPTPAAAPAKRTSSGRSGQYGTTDPAMASTLQNPAALQRLWQAAMSDLKRTKPAYNVMFINTRIGCDGAGEGILISFPASNSFAYTAVQRPDVVESVSEALTRAAGMPVAFRVEQDSAGAGQGTPGAPAVPAPSVPQAPAVPAAPSASQALAASQAPVMPAATPASAPTPQPGAAPAVPAPSGGVVPAASPASVAGSADAASQPAAAVQPAQPVMPRLRRSAASLDGSSRAAAMPGEEAPDSGNAGVSARTGVASEEGVSEEVAADMPRPAPKRKKPLPVPGEGVKPPTYVREGIREERVDESSAVKTGTHAEMEAPKATAPSSAPAFAPAAAPAFEPAAAPAAPAAPAIPAAAPATPATPTTPAVAPAVDDEYDRVPLDAYEGMPYPEDDVLPWEDAPAARPAAPSPASTPAPSVASAPASSGLVARPNAAPVPAAQSAVPAPAPASVPSAAFPSAPAPTPVAQPVVPAAPVPMAAPAPAPTPAPATPPSGPEPTADELNAFLSAGFGEGVVFQEVRE